MATKSVTIRIPLEIIERVQTAAKQRRTTFTDVLIGPWRQAPEPAENLGHHGRKARDRKA